VDETGTGSDFFFPVASFVTGGVEPSDYASRVHLIHKTGMGK